MSFAFTTHPQTVSCTFVDRLDSKQYLSTLIICMGDSLGFIRRNNNRWQKPSETSIFRAHTKLNLLGALRREACCHRVFGLNTAYTRTRKHTMATDFTTGESGCPPVFFRTSSSSLYLYLRRVVLLRPGRVESPRGSHHGFSGEPVPVSITALESVPVRLRKASL